MRITSAGNVGIGTNSPSYPLHIVRATGDTGLRVQTAGAYTSVSVQNATTTLDLQANDGVEAGAVVYNNTGGNYSHVWYNFGGERMRLNGTGNLGIGGVSPGNRLYVTKSDNTYYLTDFANSITSGNGYVNRMMFSGSAPNSTGSIFSAMVDTSTSRCVIYANGGIHNYQANNVNLSDRREKTNFAPAKSYLDIICNIPVQTFNYIDQNLEEDDGLTLGVVAQDIQEVAPELVMESNWGTEEEPKMRLSVYQTDLQYALMKSIQELKAIVDAQAVEIAALKA
jgi:hypothetical protein